MEQFANIAQTFIDSGDFKYVIPGADHDSPWSTSSLHECEKLFLQTQDPTSAWVQEKYTMFLGEGLRRAFGGKWERGELLIPESHGMRGIHYPTTGHFDVVSNYLQEAVRLGVGKTWATHFTTTKMLLSEATPTE